MYRSKTLYSSIGDIEEEARGDIGAKWQSDFFLFSFSLSLSPIYNLIIQNYFLKQYERQRCRYTYIYIYIGIKKI